MSEIRTARLLLRRARATDLHDIHAILSDVEGMRYWATAPHETLDQSREWLQAMIEAPADRSDDYVVERDGEVVGKAGCWRLPEVGFIFRRDQWGQGIALEALEAVIGVIFERHRLERIRADVDPRNAACLKLLARLGFEETGRAKGTYTINGEVSDSVYLALPRSA